MFCLKDEGGDISDYGCAHIACVSIFGGRTLALSCNEKVVQRGIFMEGRVGRPANAFFQMAKSFVVT